MISFVGFSVLVVHGKASSSSLCRYGMAQPGRSGVVAFFVAWQANHGEIKVYRKQRGKENLKKACLARLTRNIGIKKPLGSYEHSTKRFGSVIKTDRFFRKNKPECFTSLDLNDKLDWVVTSNNRYYSDF
jgi:hypothetical protein